MLTVKQHRVFRFFRWIKNRLPLYSWNRACSEWERGRIEGMKMERTSNGFYRGAKGRYVSIARNEQHSQSRPMTDEEKRLTDGFFADQFKPNTQVQGAQQPPIATLTDAYGRSL